MNEQQQQQEQLQFDPQKPCKTRNGFDVYTIPFPKKILGFVYDEAGDAVVCEWDLQGYKKSVYPRKGNEKHELDLVNVDG